MKKNKYEISVVKIVSIEATSSQEAVEKACRKGLVEIENVMGCRKSIKGK